MNTVVLESRPELELNSCVRAFRPLGDLLYAGFDELSIDRLVEEVAAQQTRVVVLDLQDANYLSASALSGLIVLKRRLSRTFCLLVLLTQSPTLREMLLGAGLSRVFVTASSLEELTERLELATNPPDEGVTEETLAEARDADISFEDILREKHL